MEVIKEVFVPVKGWEGHYELNNFGIMFSIKTGSRIRVNGWIDVTGYRSVTLTDHFSIPKRRITKRVHALMAESFLPNPNEYKVVNHKNGDKLDNGIWNLEWCTLAQNVKHAVATGLMDLKGEKHAHSKLTEQDVIAARYLAGIGCKHEDITIIINKVSRRQLTDVINGVNWGWLKPSLKEIKEELNYM